MKNKIQKNKSEKIYTSNEVMSMLKGINDKIWAIVKQQRKISNDEKHQVN